MHKIVLIGLTLALLQTPIAKAADVSHGQALAQRWCAACHAIAAESAPTRDVPPSFKSIANREGFDVNKLAFFLLNPHPVMPNMGLSRSEATDLSAYIASLRN